MHEEVKSLAEDVWEMEEELAGIAGADEVEVDPFERPAKCRARYDGIEDVETGLQRLEDPASRLTSRPGVGGVSVIVTNRTQDDGVTAEITFTVERGEAR